MRCVNCGHENNNDSKFCVRCGKELNVDNYVICDFCGGHNTKDGVYCTHCGRPLVKLDNAQDIVDKKLCSACGHKNDMKNSFCVKCGSSLEEATIVQVYNGEQKETKIEENAEKVKEYIPYKHHKFTILTMILTFAFIFIPIVGQVASTIMSIIALLKASKEVKVSGNEEAKTSLVFSIISLAISVVLVIIFIISFIEFININPHVVTPDEGTGQELLRVICG